MITTAPREVMVVLSITGTVLCMVELVSIVPSGWFLDNDGV